MTKIISPLVFLIPIMGLLAQDDDFDLECCPSSKAGQVRPVCCPPWTITPEASPTVCCGWNAYIKADFIYWTAREDHLAFAYREPFQSPLGVTGSGHVYDPDWTFEPGFKVGIGVLQNHDGWDISALYTWLTVRNTRKSVERGENEVIEPIGGFDAAGGLLTIDQIRANWELNFNTVDFILGRNFYISHCLTLRPSFGLKGTWQDQLFCVTSEGSNFGFVPSFGENENKLEYWGIGIRAGLDTAWYIYRCFSFIGNVAISGLWEKFEVKKHSRNIPIEGGDWVGVLDIENRYFTLKPVLELMLGFRWETWFCCDQYHFSILGAWEEQWWSDQNQFFNPLTESRQGDLYFHGLTLEFRLDF